QEAIDRGKQFMLVEEYFSTTALLGAVLTHVEKNGDKAGSKPIYVIPENEGAEVDGQYADFIRAKIKRVTHKAFEIYSPFLEDLIYSEDKEWMDMIINTLILGDLVRLSPSYHREAILSEVFEAIERKAVDLYWIKNITERVSALVDGLRDGKRVLTVGDPFLLFNDRMNNFNFRQLEQRNIRLIYTPLSEYYLMFWKDHADFNGKNGDENFKRNISTLKEKIELISEIMGENSNIDDDYPRLKGLADEHIGYYSGMNGRYRYAKVHSDALLTDGIITVSSMYENTGIMLNILKNDKLLSKPVLNLTFDGNKNENDRMKIESFIYYI
ncbi:MAG TPA: CoA activase, partial [Thermotogota bacterium]|nr:CoA activase [Thermotogota bacterium]